MRHEYYGYSKEELLANPKISLVCMADNEQVFRHMAGEMAETIEAHNAEGKTTGSYGSSSELPRFYGKNGVFEGETGVGNAARTESIPGSQ